MFLLFTSLQDKITMSKFISRRITVAKRKVTLMTQHEISRRRMLSDINVITTEAGSNSDVIHIDGSLGEGGGQIIRNAISYANILRKEIRISNIRAGRMKPGLREQHYRGLQLATAICGGTLHGDSLGSTELHYKPLDIPKLSNNKTIRHISGKIETAGSICLLLQAALPCALFSPTPVILHLSGGTNATLAPQYDYWSTIFLPALVTRCKLHQSQISANVIRRGYYPKGGGIVEVHVQPLIGKLNPISLVKRGKLKKICIRSFYSGDIPQIVAFKMAHEAKVYMKERIQNDVYEIATECHEGVLGSGTGILLTACYDTGCQLAGSALLVGSLKKNTARDVGGAAAEELYQAIMDGGCVDDWLQDQLILYMALAEGYSEILTGSITLHTYTAILIAEQLTGVKFEIIKVDDDGNTSNTRYSSNHYGKIGRIDGKHIVRCQGIGFHRSTS